MTQHHRWRPRRWAAPAAVTAAVHTGVAAAAVVFTVELNGPSGLPADQFFIGTLGPAGGMPVTIGGGVNSGLGLAGDDVDAVSRRASDIDVVVCFSVDSDSDGDDPPVGPQGVFPPFFVAEQADKGQQAGDAYVSTEAFNRQTGKLPPPISIGDDFHVLAINQAPMYVADFSLMPDIGPEVFFDGGDIDNVNGETCVEDTQTPGVFYFSLDAQSPSLPGLPGPISGANIYRDLDITAPPGTQLYATPPAIGLLGADELDALVVSAPDDVGPFNAGQDFVVFSLAPGSPTLLINGWSPADLLVFDNLGLRVLAFHFELGLLPTDNIDSLAFIPLINGNAQDTLDSLLSGVPPACPGPGVTPIPVSNPFVLAATGVLIALAGGWWLSRGG